MANYGETIWYPKSHITEVPENHRYVQIFRDYWWAVNEEGEVAFYEDRSPQCNLSEKLVKRMIERGVPSGAVNVEQIPLAFVRINISDYCD